MLRKFIGDRRGNLAVFTVAAMIPLLLSVGFGLDYARHSAAHKNLQEVADAAALALAATKNDSETEARKLAEDVIAANTARTRLDTVSIAALETTDDYVDLSLDGAIPATFMGLAGWETLNVAASAKAERAVTGSVEVALVLDNTYSMAETDAKGISKIASLKSAANSLVAELLADGTADVKVGLVPYADYVNVGTQYRNQPWLSVPPDSYTPGTSKSGCTTTTVPRGANECKRWNKTTCTTYPDGVPVTTSCNGTCAEYYPAGSTKQVENCDQPGKAAVTKKWYGCIGSRQSGTTRLDDKSPSVPYPGYVETSQKCLNPVVTLTTDRDKVTTAIDGMIINIGTGYRPQTYIPAGMIWGVNVLSPTEPFSEGTAYDPANKTPRKAIVLMTDGENTMRFRSSDGRHISIDYEKDANGKPKLDSNGKLIPTQAGRTQLATVNAETLSICTYAKNNKIEVFTVAFMVDDADAKTMLQSCATDSEHYFDASDPDKLMAAFSGIARSLSIVRLAR